MSIVDRVTVIPLNRLASGLGVLGGALAAVGTNATWFTISIGDITAPGGSATGWDGRDGRTVLAAAVAAGVAAALIALDTRRLAPKIALIVAGGLTGVIGVAGVLDTQAKAEAVEDEFAIPADRVDATVGAGLWLVTGAGVIEVLAGAVARPPAAPERRRLGRRLRRSPDRRAGGSAAAAAR